MQLSDVSSLRGFSEQLAEGVTLTQLYPHLGESNGLLALDLLEVEAGSQSPLRSSGEEQVLFVVSGTGELSQDGTSVSVKAGAVVSLNPFEGYSIRNTDNVRLRVLVSSSLVARTGRALGVRASSAPAATPPARTAPATPPERRAPAVTELTPVAEAAVEVTNGRAEPEEAPATVQPAEEAPAVAPPDISSLMKRGADVPAKPRSEQRKPRPEPEPEPAPQPEAPAEEAQDEDASEQATLMELYVVFDGGSRGNPGQGYGSFLVQSPGRKPVIKRLEFGDNYTNNQAEYDSLIGSLNYIIERLNTTGRSPDQVQLDIKTDSDLVVNQILGNFKVKDAGLRKRHEQATDLLGQFADWTISWHPRDESVKLLGH
ncbi:MAG: ribonuclease [Chloroflexia bacterium]|jgi:ribonuclease HI/quercetin dioxygenase-like cupin family protein|nr:ribonuclease [Chloroflexia bacterium]